jgi:peptidoglycan hydrolase FlgJ
MTTPLQPLSAPSSTVSTPAISTAAASTSAGNTYTDLNGLSALKNAPSSPATIRAVSQQVEALFLQMMLKSMRDASAGDGELDSNETGMYQDMFDKQVALTLSKRQDLGIARLFERQLGGKAAQTEPAARTAPAVPLALPKTGLSTPGPHPDGRSGAEQASDSATAHHAAQFVSAVLPTIRRAAQSLGVNPLGLLAQAALETGWGKRMARTADGSPSLNMFGIKAGEGWTGARAVADTVEFSGGVATQKRTAFRAYGSIEESVSDFAKLLGNSPRYRDAIAAGGSAQAYIHSIARSGYATDPDYGNKLNQILNSSTLRAALSARVTAL